MIEKLKNIPLDMNGKPSAVWLKINELVDYVNTLCQEHDIHEEQIDDLQIKTDGIIDDIEHLEKHNPCQHEPFDYIGVRPSMAQTSNAEPHKTTYNVVTGEMEAPELAEEPPRALDILLDAEAKYFAALENIDKKHRGLETVEQINKLTKDIEKLCK